MFFSTKRTFNIREKNRPDAYHFIEEKPEKVLTFFQNNLINIQKQNTMEINNTAILVVEFQKTWSEKSFFHKLIKKQYITRNVFQNTKKLLDYARTKGIKIIQAPLILDKTDKKNISKFRFNRNFLSNLQQIHRKQNTQKAFI